MTGLNKLTSYMRRKRITAGDFLIGIFLVVVTLMALLPFVHLLMTSLSDATTLRYGFRMLPSKFTWDSYVDAIKSPNMLSGLRNSLVRVLVAVPLTVIINSMAAYATSKQDMVGGKFLRIFFMLTMYLNAGMIPIFITMKNYGLVGTFWVYLVAVCTPFFMILIRNYFLGVPQSLEDAALLDGAGYWSYFVRILIPVSKPILATVVLFTFVNHWNMYTDTLIYNLTKQDLYTLQYVLYLSLSSAKSSSYADGGSFKDFSSVSTTTLQAALTMITLIPLVVIYPFLQRFIVSGVTLGAVKE